MASGIFAVARIGAVRLYVGEVHHLKTRWPQMMAQLEAGTFADATVQQAWQVTQGERCFSFHTAKDIDADTTLRGRYLFQKDAAS